MNYGVKLWAFSGNHKYSSVTAIGVGWSILGHLVKPKHVLVLLLRESYEFIMLLKQSNMRQGLGNPMMLYDMRCNGKLLTDFQSRNLR